mmetsp:Transcript_12204/g.29651  ORF Transcript_12204/g.29651 Transcript_12204/m.29651 type:complete len:150 (-) Transcript_12204:752-1201(-)
MGSTFDGFFEETSGIARLRHTTVTSEESVPSKVLADFRFCASHLFRLIFDATCREEHIQRKVDAMVKEAKTKMGKGDKKGGSFVNDSLDHKCFSVDQNHQLLTCTCTIFIFDSWFQSAGLDIDLILNTALFAIISIWCLFTTGFIRRGK